MLQDKRFGREGGKTFIIGFVISRLTDFPALLRRSGYAKASKIISIYDFPIEYQSYGRSIQD
jgi:hypothetical protein